MVSLRLATPSDAGALWRIFSAIFLEGTTYAPDEELREPDFLRDWFGRGGEQWVGESEGRVVGAYTLRPNQPGRGAHVATASYGVEAAARGMGVGLLLGDTHSSAHRPWGTEPSSSTSSSAPTLRPSASGSGSASTSVPRCRAPFGTGFWETSTPTSCGADSVVRLSLPRERGYCSPP